MHLLAHIPTPDYAPWKTAFDAHAEDRDASGLTLLQFWRGADDPNAVTALFECHDRARAQGPFREDRMTAPPSPTSRPVRPLRSALPSPRSGGGVGEGVPRVERSGTAP